VPVRISASSYLNTAPLVWSFLYGRHHGQVEIILDNAPARSAELLSQRRVDAALVPVFAYQSIDEVYLVPNVCVGAQNRVRSVCLVTRDKELSEVRSCALDVSSRTSAAATKIIFKEFIGLEPEWRLAEPDIETMLAGSDSALIIGDPALKLSSADYRVFDIAELWNKFTGLGFVFAMWVTTSQEAPIDFADARDEGVAHVDEIIGNYSDQVDLTRDELKEYLTENINYSVNEKMRQGMELYFKLAERHKLITKVKELRFAS
jgi:chorismate dehydratase